MPCRLACEGSSARARKLLTSGASFGCAMLHALSMQRCSPGVKCQESGGSRGRQCHRPCHLQQGECNEPASKWFENHRR